MLNIDGRQVKIELTTLPSPYGFPIPDRIKTRMLEALNWEDFIRRHCKRRNLGFSEEESFQLCYIENSVA